jgi:hypothetical protein
MSMKPGTPSRRWAALVPGFKWCSRCERLKPREDFYQGGRGWCQAECKACHRIVARESYRRVARRAKPWRQRTAAA